MFGGKTECMVQNTFYFLLHYDLHIFILSFKDFGYFLPHSAPTQLAGFACWGHDVVLQSADITSSGPYVTLCDNKPGLTASLLAGRSLRLPWPWGNR